MTIYEAMNERHSVRKYTDRPIEAEKIAALNEEIEKINAESGLNIELILDEPNAFSGTLAKYGHFSGCTSYFCISAPDGKDEEIGYFGEKLVLLSQMLGLILYSYFTPYSTKNLSKTSHALTRDVLKKI